MTDANRFPLRFSMRSMFMVAALIAVAIVFVANYPFLTAMFLLLIGPMLVRAGLTPYARAIAARHVYWIVAVLQACYSVGCGLCLLRLFPPYRLYAPGWRVYTGLGALSGIAMLCVCLMLWQREEGGAGIGVERDETASDQNGRAI